MTENGFHIMQLHLKEKLLYYTANETNGHCPTVEPQQTRLYLIQSIILNLNFSSAQQQQESYFFLKKYLKILE